MSDGDDGWEETDTHCRHGVSWDEPCDECVQDDFDDDELGDDDLDDDEDEDDYDADELDPY